MAYHKIENFPAYVSNTTGVLQVMKKLPQVHELRAGIIRARGTIKSTSTAFNFACTPNDLTAVGGTNDTLAMLNAIFTNFYLKRDDIERVYNVKPVDLMIAYGAQHRRLMGLSSSLRNGDALPASGGTAMNWQIDIPFDFTHSGFGDTPNKFAPGTEQALVNGGWAFSYDTANTTLSSTTLKNGTGNIAITSIELGADVEPCDYPIVAPAWGLEYDKEPNLINERVGAAMELLLYEQSLPATLDAAITSLDVLVDGNIPEVVAARPSDLADAYARNQKALDGAAPFAVERNCSPIRWIQSQVHPEEREYRYHLSKRAVTFNGSSATRNLVRQRIYPFAYKAAATFEAVKAAYYPNVKTTWDKAAVRFPCRDPLIDQVFGARFLADF